MEDKLIGHFVPVNGILDKLSEIIYKSRFPDDIAKFTVDLSIERNNKRLSNIGGGEGLFDYNAKYPTWQYLKILSKGTGIWTITFEIPGKKTISLTNDEVNSGDEMSLEFTELYFTNTAQSGVDNLTLWLEKRYF